MRFPWRTRVRRRSAASILIASLFCPSALPAYIDQLSDSDVLEAYRLGQRHDQDAAKFFRDYEASFPNAVQGLRVQHLAIRTPYCAVVVRSFEAGSMYPLRQAVADAAERADVFEVVVWLDGAANSSITPNDIADLKNRFWGQFDVQLSQEHKIAPRKMRASPLYERTGRPSTTIIGAQVWVEYDVRDVASALIHIQATDPQGRSVSAEFDLDKLR
jgi:hypothetical protein